MIRALRIIGWTLASISAALLSGASDDWLCWVFAGATIVTMAYAIRDILSESEM